MKLHEKISLDKYINKLTIDRLEQDRKHFYGDLNKENILRKSIIYPQLIVFIPTWANSNLYSDPEIYQKIAHYCQINPEIKKQFERTCAIEKNIDRCQNEFPGPVKLNQLRRHPLPAKKKEIYEKTK